MLLLCVCVGGNTGDALSAFQLLHGRSRQQAGQGGHTRAALPTSSVGTAAGPARGTPNLPVLTDDYRTGPSQTGLGVWRAERHGHCSSRLLPGVALPRGALTTRYPGAAATRTH